MTARVLQAWYEFWFHPQSALPLAVFRIIFGLLVMLDLLLLKPEWLVWYGSHGFTTLGTIQAVEHGPRLNLFMLLPQVDWVINVFFWCFLLFAVLLTIGCLTRTSSLVVFLCLNSIHLRNPYIINGGDTLLRLSSFWLSLGPAGAVLSVDRLWRRGDVRPLHAPWAQRMIQIQMAAMYIAAVCWKLSGDGWINGTTLYYALHIEDLRRFPIPDVTNPIVLTSASWATLLIEISLAVLVWFRKYRLIALGCGICLHTSIEYAMNIPIFEWIVLATYVTFIYPAELLRAWLRMRAVIGKRFVTMERSLEMKERRHLANGV